MIHESRPRILNREIYLAALEISNPDQQQAYLNDACGGDAARRAQIEQLLAAHAIQQTNPLDMAVQQMDPVETLPSEPSTGKRSELFAPPVIDRYKIREQIGEGGMGIVYVAEQTSPVRRKVALKIIKPGMGSKDIVARFEAERQTLAMMNHSNIAKMLDAGTTESGLPYFVMELVKGTPITEYCDAHKLDLQQRMELFINVCEAVQHAHQKGIIHRDLKPSNVLVELEDVRSVPKVIDFGVAKATQQPLVENAVYTGLSQMIGTPLYMSPEQAEYNSLDVDTRSDVYSLGVILYELITGSTPFDREILKRVGFDEMRRIIREDEPPRPSSRITTQPTAQLSTVSRHRKVDPRKLSSDIKDELDWIVMKSLDKDRTRRYQSAAVLAEDIQRYLNDEPVLACPPTVWYRCRKTAVRNKSLILTGLAVVCAMLVGTAVSIAQAVRATRAEQGKEVALQQARRAVDEMYTEVAEKWLGEQGTLTAVQRQFLEKALAFYQSFSAESAASPDVQFATMRALHRVAAIQQRLGNTADAQKTFQQMADTSSNYVSQHADRPEFRIELLLAHSELARLYRTIGRKNDVDKQLDRAYPEVTPLAAAKLEKLAYREILATSLNLLSGQLTETGRLEDSDLVNELALRTWQSLVDQHPRDFDYRFGLAVTYGRIAMRHMWWGSFDAKAESNFQQAETLFTKLLEERPGDAKCRRQLAANLQNFAVVLGWKDRKDEAIPVERRALAVKEMLAKDFPDNPDDQTSFSICLTNLATTLAETAKGVPGEVEALRLRAHSINEGLVHQFPQLLEPRKLFLQSIEAVSNCLYQSGRQNELDSFYRRNARKLGESAALPNTGAIPNLAARNLHRWAALLLERGDHALALQVLNKYPPSLCEFEFDNPIKVAAPAKTPSHRRESYEGQTYFLLNQAALLEECAALADEDVSVLPPQRSATTKSCVARAQSLRGQADKAIDAWIQLLVKDDNGASVARVGEQIIEKWNKVRVSKVIPVVLRNAYVTTEELMFRRLIDVAADRLRDSPSQKFLSQLLSTAPVELRNIDLAMKCARRSIELQPENKECWNALSWALFRTEEWQECLGALDKGLEDGTQSIRIMALWQLGRQDEARTLFDGDQKRLKEYEAKVAEARTRNVRYYPLPETFARLYKEAAAMLGAVSAESSTPPESTPAT